MSWTVAGPWTRCSGYELAKVMRDLAWAINERARAVCEAERFEDNVLVWWVIKDGTEKQWPTVEDFIPLALHGLVMHRFLERAKWALFGGGGEMYGAPGETPTLRTILSIVPDDDDDEKIFSYVDNGNFYAAWAKDPANGASTDIDDYWSWPDLRDAVIAETGITWEELTDYNPGYVHWTSINEYKTFSRIWEFYRLALEKLQWVTYWPRVPAASEPDTTETDAEVRTGESTPGEIPGGTADDYTDLAWSRMLSETWGSALSPVAQARVKILSTYEVEGKRADYVIETARCKGEILEQFEAVKITGRPYTGTFTLDCGGYSMAVDDDVTEQQFLARESDWLVTDAESPCTIDLDPPTVRPADFMELTVVPFTYTSDGPLLLATRINSIRMLCDLSGVFTYG